MKFEDMTVGLCVHDQWGNEYVVDKIGYNPYNGYALRLRCTKHVKPIRADVSATFTRVDDSWWIQASRDKLLNSEDPTVQHLLKTLGYKVSAKAHTPVTLSDAAGVACSFFAYPSANLMLLN